MKELLRHARTIAGVHLTGTQYRDFQCYEHTLVEWNQRINLTAIKDPGQIQIKHFLDSLTCMVAMSESTRDRVIDVGTGAGFPGMPLKIACPEIQLTLVESIGKKAEFCRQLAQTLEMQGVEIVQDRAETIGQSPQHRQKYDWAVARAVAEMAVLAEYLLPLVRVGGSMLAMKGERAPAETQQAEYAIQMLGGRIRKLVHVTLPGVAEERYLVIIDKVAATPQQFPRKKGIPAKRPLRK
jgi:16S rRNA (guanine527-N7)-methyltransferase